MPYARDRSDLMPRLVKDDGRLDAPIVVIGDVLRFIKFVRPKKSGCWLWAGTHNQKGYPKFWWNGQTGLAMHFILQVAERPKPQPHFEPDHLCRTPGCVNYDHLEWVTRRINLLRGDSPIGINARKTRCIHGHIFDEANTRVLASGERRCRTCERLNARRYYQRNPRKAAAKALARKRKRVAFN